MKKIPVIISFDVHSHNYKDKLNELPFWFERTLKILDNNSIKATFFFPTECAELFPNDVRMIQDEEHEIGCHSLTHLSDEQYVREDQRLSWNHNQKFDPTQRLAIKYEYVSNKDAYQNSQEISLQNRLKQNLSSSFNYNKNWKSSSISIGFNQFRDLSIENTTPQAAGYLNQERYKSYKSTQLQLHLQPVDNVESEKYLKFYIS